MKPYLPSTTNSNTCYLGPKLVTSSFNVESWMWIGMVTKTSLVTWPIEMWDAWRSRRTLWIFLLPVRQELWYFLKSFAGLGCFNIVSTWHKIITFKIRNQNGIFIILSYFLILRNEILHSKQECQNYPIYLNTIFPAIRREILYIRSFNYFGSKYHFLFVAFFRLLILC